MTPKRAGKEPAVFMNAVTIELLIKYYYMGNEPSTNSQAYQEAKAFLLKHELIGDNDEEASIVISEKGKYWVNFVLTKCPIPQQVLAYQVQIPND